MESMTNRQALYASVFCLIGMTLVIITHLVRPHLGGVHKEIVFIFGVLPNFAAAFGLPFMMILLVIHYLRFEKCGGKLIYCFVLALGVTFCGLTAWEIIQALVWGIPSDPNDIAATGLGCVCAMGAYLLFLRAGKLVDKP